MFRFVFLLLCITFLNFQCRAQWNEKAYQHASIGISIVNIQNGEAIITYNHKQSLTPASTLKLITTATALDKHGSDQKFVTSLGMTGTIDQQGALQGDLIIKGNGDATLGSQYFKETNRNFMADWIRALKEAGIHSVQGNVITDLSALYPEPIPTRWIWEDIGNYYGAGVYALNCFDNQYRVFFNAAKIGQKASISHVSPAIDNLSFEVQAYGDRSPSDSAYIFGGPHQWHKIIRGHIPANKIDFSIKGAMPDPPHVLGQMFIQALHKNGISFRGELKQSYTPTNSLRILHQTWSPSLASIAQVTNFKSNNLFAEQLLRTLNPQKDISGLTHDLITHWNNKGISTTSCFLYDGSGLSPSDAVSAKFITDILSYMYNSSEEYTAFQSSIPQAGKEGSVNYFLKELTTARARVKSGSMDKVRCYAGYIEKDSHTYAFAILLNNFTCTQTKAIQDIESYLYTTIRKL